MSRALSELTALNQGYTRLAEKFKVVWTFHQFLQGLFKTFFGIAPAYRIDFQARYDQVKSVTAAMTFQPADVVARLVQRLDAELETIHRTLAEAEQRVAPSDLRRFFERVKTEDEKLVVSVLKFYFYLRLAPPDVIDKMDFLLTLAGSRRSPEDGRYLPRVAPELQRLLAGLVGLAPRAPVDPHLARSAVEQLDAYRSRLERCQQFEELVETNVLELLRAFKHNLGTAFYDGEVLTALLSANLAAKNTFVSLYESEERRIVESSRQLLSMERELALRGPAALDRDLVQEFERFHQYRRELEVSEKGVRRQDVARLAESIDSLMARLELAPRPEAAMSQAAPPEVRGPASVPGTRAPISALETDPLTADWAARILSSVEMADEGTASGRAAHEGRALAHLRLEPWEVRAARHLVRAELPPDPADRSREQLYFEAAVVRLRIDDEAEAMRGPAASIAPSRLLECSAVLVRAQDLDWRFRQEVDTASRSGLPERLNEVNRSRFRLLRAFSGLWLIHNREAAKGPKET